uniref:Uncharacterized protein n=1 Tax=Arundo donax TaxID=35708 RepID=A0A0A9BWP4_ARUDO
MRSAQCWCSGTVEWQTGNGGVRC